MLGLKLMQLVSRGRETPSPVLGKQSCTATDDSSEFGPSLQLHLPWPYKHCLMAGIRMQQKGLKGECSVGARGCVKARSIRSGSRLPRSKVKLQFAALEERNQACRSWTRSKPDFSRALGTAQDSHWSCPPPPPVKPAVVGISLPKASPGICPVLLTACSLIWMQQCHGQ